MSHLRRSPEALDDLVEIWTCIAPHNLSAADRLIAEFDQRFQLLAAQPLIGERCYVRRRSLRRLSHGNYVIYYRVRAQAVEIVRVLHGARDHRRWL